MMNQSDNFVVTQEIIDIQGIVIELEMIGCWATAEIFRQWLDEAIQRELGRSEPTQQAA